ncbi:FAD-dependent oxidoreductase [Nocardia sp. NPDC019395]|uniref:NAD(P)/FAD-dependent oxidoreductase n=1 Tax=Nocardia sp. NPDC019395 TaxID=3154686 RepID=UPI0033C813BB
MSRSARSGSRDRGAFDVLIVGAGHAGVQVAASLAHSFEGSIGVLSGELCEPYEKPPLTKGFLNGAVTESELLLRPSAFWQESGVTLLLDRRVATVDPDAHVVVTVQGERFGYGRLVWAAGADPIRIGLPGVDLPGVHELRTLEDTVRFRAEIRPGKKVVVIGGGYVGLEAASACVKLGAEVTIVEARSRLLARVTGAEVAEYVLRRHLDHGAHVELDAAVTGIAETDGRAGGVLLSDGRDIPADVVLVSVGIQPNTGVLAAAGARCSNGIEVDLQGRTSLPDVYAAGDCTCFPGDDGGSVRLESLQNAVEQGEIVAKSIMGEDATYGVVPYFWSNQYDIKIKTIGLFTEHDETIVRTGSGSSAFSVVYLRNGRVCAVDSINAMKDYVDARQVLGARIAPSAVLDPAVRLRDAIVADPAGDVPS